MNNKRLVIITVIAVLLAATTVLSFAKDAQDAKQNKTVYVKTAKNSP